MDIIVSKKLRTALQDNAEEFRQLLEHLWDADGITMAAHDELASLVDD